MLKKTGQTAFQNPKSISYLPSRLRPRIDMKLANMLRSGSLETPASADGFCERARDLCARPAHAAERIADRLKGIPRLRAETAVIRSFHSLR
jgi:hypothetical protein